MYILIYNISIHILYIYMRKVFPSLFKAHKNYLIFKTYFKYFDEFNYLELITKNIGFCKL